MCSLFKDIKESVVDTNLLLHLLHNEDKFPQKIDSSIGVYRTNEYKPYVLSAVRKAEKLIANDDSLTHEYLPPLGLPGFSSLATRLLLGDDSPALREGRVLSSQASGSGTGALKILVDFLRKCCSATTVYLSDPNWPNHQVLFEHANYTDIRTYRYWDHATRSLDLPGMLEDLSRAPKRSVVLLHASCHNPTGVDPTPGQWKQIADLVERKQLITFFDCAYQGFASGDTDEDAQAVRYFVSRGLELVCAQSFAKNFGLYDERVGNLFFVVNDSTLISKMRAQLFTIIRANYLSPPKQGALIVKTILSDPALFAEWRENLKGMAKRLIQIRAILREKLEELDTPGDWSHITQQAGMYSYTGLTPNQCKHLLEVYHIYLPETGRIVMSNINTHNVDYLARAIAETIKKIGDCSGDYKIEI